MKFQYLGTAAAEGVPGMFCECEVCRRSLELGGRYIRTRSQAIIDDTLLIDFPADTFSHMLTYGLRLPEIHHCIVTHSHSDHWYPADLEMRTVGFANGKDLGTLTIYGTSAVAADCRRMMEAYGLNKENRIACQEIRPFQPFVIGCYTITPLRADHDPASDPVFFLIQKDEDGVQKNLLYANDTGIFPQETWDWLEQHPCHLDFVSLDCTAALLTGWEHGHLGLDTDVQVASRLKAMGLADEQTRWCVHHFSHNGRATHEELTQAAAKYGFGVSYDGKTINL